MMQCGRAMDQVNVVKVTKEKTIQGRQFNRVVNGNTIQDRFVCWGEFHAPLFSELC